MAINPFRKGGTDTIPISEGGTGATDAATARANLGAGDLDETAHDLLDHTGLPGIPAALTPTALTYTFTWTNTNTAQSTGNLGFTPLFAIAIGVFSHDATGSAAAGFSASDNSTISVGMATGTATNAFSVAQHCETTGSSDEDTTAHDSDSIGGVSAVGSGAALSHGVAEIDVTAWSTTGITVDPNVNVTCRLTLLVVGF